jgi:hypothetical protein
MKMDFKIIGSFMMVLAGIAFGPGIPWCQEDSRALEAGLTAALDQDFVHLGSVVVLSLKYRLPKDARLITPIKIEGLAGLNELDREKKGDKIHIRLLVDKLGSWQTGPIALGYTDKGGENAYLKTEAVSATVLSNLGERPEDATLRPIQGIIPTRSRLHQYLLWASMLSAFVLTGMGLYLWRAHKRRIRNLSATVVDPPHVKAQRELVNLQGERLFERGNVKGFYFRFSEILREYLEAIRGFPAAEFTTEEIVQSIDTEPDRILIPLLRESDLVKFADRIPSQARKDEVIRVALAYIENTSPEGPTNHSPVSSIAKEA